MASTPTLIVFEGELQKKSPKGIESWQTRHYELDTFSLRWFPRKAGKALGIVPLDTIISVTAVSLPDKPAGCGFDFVAGERTFHLLAKSPDDCRQWISKINEHVDKCRALPPGVRPAIEQDGKFWKRTSAMIIRQNTAHTLGTTPTTPRAGVEGGADEKAMAAMIVGAGAISFEGPLQKKSPKGITGLHAWQTRHFTLHADFLVYHKKKGDAMPAGVIELFTIVEVRRLDKKGGARIDIDLSGRDKPLSLLAGSSQFAVKWVEWLTRFISPAKEKYREVRAKQLADLNGSVAKIVAANTTTTAAPTAAVSPPMIIAPSTPRAVSTPATTAPSSSTNTSSPSVVTFAPLTTEIKTPRATSMITSSSSTSTATAGAATPKAGDDTDDDDDDDDEDGDNKVPDDKKADKEFCAINAIRGLVSKKKLRFQEDGFDLDLSYITPRIIAMGFPADGAAGVYRNNIKEVQRFFKARHDGHYKIYNLCIEKGMTYDTSIFDGSCARFPFPDHNPCPFALIQQFCEDAQNYLRSDEKNVIAVHCKAGKGRTGLMISAFLVFNGDCANATDALSFYGGKRTSNKKGVTIPSQQRYVAYFDRFFHHYGGNARALPSKQLIIRKIALAPKADFDVGGGCDPYFTINYHNEKAHYSYKKDKTKKVKPWRKNDGPLAELNCKLLLPPLNDIHIMFYDRDAVGSDDKMFGLWINTAFIDVTQPLVLTKSELDKAVKDKKCHHFPKDFTCTIYFEEAPATSSTEHYDTSDGSEVAPAPKKGSANKDDVPATRNASSSVAISTPKAATSAPSFGRAVSSVPSGSKDKTTDDKKAAGWSAANAIRGLVSKKKLRFQEDGFDLDLSYITPRIIAMGFPSEGTAGVYRNNSKDVQRFFKTRHDGHYKIYNLCAEKGMTYDTSLFDDSCARFPFPDHNPCPFPVILSFCEDAHRFMHADEKNTIAVHCKAGKGRTGLMISSYLLYSSACENAAAALKFFATERTHNAKGVTIPSQLRYVGYFDRFLRDYLRAPPSRSFPNTPPSVTITGFKLRPKADFDVGGGCDPYARIYVDGKEIYNMKTVMSGKIRAWRKEPSIELKIKVPVAGDVRIMFMDKDHVGKDDKMFSFWFNTAFIDPNVPLLLTKKELDGAVKDKKEAHFPKDFTCEVNFEAQQDANSIFGATVAHCMSLQHATHPELKVPRIVTTMIDAVRTRQGYAMEGIFRISALKADLDGLKKQIDSGDYEIKTSSPHIPAGMLKQWMRELAAPLIPNIHYAAAIDHARAGHTDECIKIVEQLDAPSRAILELLASMSREISNETNQATSRMNIENLAIVFAPSFLRNPSNDSASLMANSKWETRFTALILAALGSGTGVTAQLASVLSSAPVTPPTSARPSLAMSPSTPTSSVIGTPSNGISLLDVTVGITPIEVDHPIPPPADDGDMEPPPPVD